MANLAFLSPDLDDLDPVITSDLDIVESLDNLLHYQPSVRAVSDTGTTINITIELGQAYSFNLFWLGYTNLTNNATWRFRSANSENNLTASPSHDSTVRNFNGEGWNSPHLLYTLPGTETNSWVLITLEDSSLDHFEFGRIYLGETIDMPLNIDHRWSSLPVSGVAHRESQKGIDFKNNLYRKRQFSFRVRFFSESQMFSTVEPLVRKHGQDKDILVLVDKDKTSLKQNFMVYGSFSEDSEIQNHDIRFYEKSFQVTEYI